VSFAEEVTKAQNFKNHASTLGMNIIYYWLVVSTQLKNINQIGNLPQIGVKIKNY